MHLSIFTVFLKNKNIIFKIRRSKVTDYAALNSETIPVLFVVLDFLLCLVDKYHRYKESSQFETLGDSQHACIAIICVFGYIPR